MVPRCKFLFQIVFFVMASNIALSQVTVSIGNVSVDGYTEDIVVPITVSNPSESVGGFQFDVMALPTIEPDTKAFIRPPRWLAFEPPPSPPTDESIP